MVWLLSFKLKVILHLEMEVLVSDSIQCLVFAQQPKNKGIGYGSASMQGDGIYDSVAIEFDTHKGL